MPKLNRVQSMLTRSLVVAACAVLSGCEDKKPPATSTSDGGAVSDKPAVDPNIAKAMAAASSRAGGGAAQQLTGGPPQNGVFAPGAADKELKPNAPPKVTLGSDGTPPRVTLGAMQPPPGFRRDLTVQVMMRSGRQGMPPVDFALGLQVQKPKPPGGAAPGASAGAPAAAPPSPAPASSEESGVPGSVDVVATVKGVRLSPSQSGGVPKEFEDLLIKLKGSKLTFRVGPNGAGDAFRYELAKGADPSLENAMRALSESLATFTLPYPDKPIGAGAFWMATTRESAIGSEVIAYRMVKVAEVSNNQIKLTVNTKRYATDAKFDLPELPKGTTYNLDQFDSQGEGEFEIKVGTPFPVSGDATLSFNAALAPANQGDQRLMVQSQTRAAFELAGK